MTKSHLEPGTFTNVIDLVLYADGLKMVLGDSPDGTERGAEHLASYYMSLTTAINLRNMLNRVFPPEPSKNAAENSGEKDGQGANPKPEPAGRPEGGVPTPTGPVANQYDGMAHGRTYP